LKPERAPVLEHILAAIICGAAIGVGLFFLKFGYLPSPFYHWKNDTFMDWYNPAYWAHRPDAYERVHSFYPPIAFEFLRLLTHPACYAGSALMGRRCDVFGYVTITFFLILSFLLSLSAFRRNAGASAWPRAIALGLSASMLYGWERGNLVLPCFAAFVISYGGLVRSAWARAAFAGVAANFKPYLLIIPVTQLLRRDWRAFCRFCVAGLAIYVFSFLLFGAGNPVQIARNAIHFMMAPADRRYGIFEFTTTYDSLLGVLESSAPLRLYLGQGLVGAARIVLPILMILGAVGATLCLMAGAWRPGALLPARGAALGLTLIFVFGSPGAYALIFLLFLVFLEPWRGAGSIIALIAAYLWCIPWDYNLAPVMHETNFSFLAGHPVGVELSLTVGELLRPGLVLMMQFGLVAAAVGDLRQSPPSHLPSLPRAARVARVAPRLKLE
jgi:hypothetical protein